jgi:UTP:GlnB (protein PII) uridylyltransferase
MPIVWLGNFTRGATLMSLDIVRGVARRNSERRWAATFEVRGASESSVQRIDFLGLARVGVEGAPSTQLELSRFELTRSTERAGMLELRTNARDRVGFLAALLGHLAGFVLFPEEIRIDTFQNVAEDALFLTSVGGQSPPAEIEAALRASLRLCTRDTASLLPGA